MRRLIVALALLLLCGSEEALSQSCGGAERWLVKVATDDAAASIDTTTAASTTVAELNSEGRPDGADQAGNTRLPQEMTAVQVKGILRLAKHETDSDFHMVLTDTAGDAFTSGGRGSQPTGASVVAEAVDPNCIAGSRGGGASVSLFQSQITAVQATVSCNIGNRLDQDIAEPVTIVGVRFFDFDHGQIGRAKNTIEIHPILGIEFANAQPGCTNAPFSSSPNTELPTPVPVTPAPDN